MKRERSEDNLTEQEIQKRLQEKQEHELKRQKLGISKRQYKKILKQQHQEETKEEFRRIKREKRKQGKKRHRNRSKVPFEKQLDSKGVRCLVDCEFDDLMNEREIVSLSGQITRMYSCKRQCQYNLPLIINSLNKRLKDRFDSMVPQYRQWKNLEINEDMTLKQKMEHDQAQGHQYVYLTADTDEEVEELQENTTYVIGGIVDKNRHKNLCVNKARELGMKVGRLPIGKYIKINGRQVLATSHVYEICCKWLEYRDWEKAFNEILPPRKLSQPALTSDSPSKEQPGNKSVDSHEESESDAESEAESDVSSSHSESKSNPKSPESK